MLEGERPREPLGFFSRFVMRFAGTLTLHKFCCFEGGCFCLFWRFAGTLTLQNFYARCTGPVLGGPRDYSMV